MKTNRKEALETLRDRFQNAPFACDALATDNAATIARIVKEKATLAREVNAGDDEILPEIDQWEKSCNELIAEL